MTPATTHRAGRRIIRARGGLAARRIFAVCLTLAAVGATAASAAPGQPGATAVVKHHRVGKPGTYRITVELWSLSAARDTVVLRVAQRTRRVTLDRGHRRVRVTLRVRVSGRSVTIRATSMLRGSPIRLAVRQISGLAPATSTPSSSTPPASGSTGATGAGGSSGLVGGGTSSGPTGATGTTGTSGSGELPSGQAMPVGDIPGWHQTYAQDFSGSSLPSEFYAYQGAPGGDPSGWFDPSHVTVSNGEMQIVSSVDPAHCPSGCTAIDNLVSGGVQLGGHAQTYGKYEIRMRVDNAEGLGFTALLWPVQNSPVGDEIDIVGDVGISPRVGTATGDVFGANLSMDEKNKTVDVTQWHTWGVEWTAGQVLFTIDGTVWATVDDPNVSSVPMNLAIQIQVACNESYTACPDASTPASSDFDVDWVTQYSPT